VTAPLEIFLAGRASEGAPEGPSLAELAERGTRSWLAAHLRHLDAERHVRVHVLVRPGSADLTDVYGRTGRGRAPLANDTSCGVGYAPLSPLERAVLAAERHLVSDGVRAAEPAFGEDVKVMGLRIDEGVTLTVACALVDRTMRHPDDVVAAKARLAERVREAAQPELDRPLTVEVNPADDPARGSFYLTVTGTSAEAGDDGEAGRGNRVNGLITPGRPMTMESVAGKNPVSHVGKLYNLAAGLLAEALVAQLPEVHAAECRLLSRIGWPVDDPPLVDLRLGGGAALGTGLAERARALAREEVARIPELWRELVDGRLGLDRWPLRAASPAR